MEQCEPLIKFHGLHIGTSLSDSHVLLSSLEVAADSLALFHSQERSPGPDTMDSSRGATPPARLADRAQPSPAGGARGGGRGWSRCPTRAPAALPQPLPAVRGEGRRARRTPREEAGPSAGFPGRTTHPLLR